MTPRRGSSILFRSSQQCPHLRLGPLKADTAPFKGTRLALCVASGIGEKQGHHQARMSQDTINNS